MLTRVDLTDDECLTNDEYLTDAEYAKIILERGPFTQEEICGWPRSVAQTYFNVMKENIQRRGAGGVAAMSDQLREMTESHLLSEPEYLGLGASTVLFKMAKGRALL